MNIHRIHSHEDYKIIKGENCVFFSVFISLIYLFLRGGRWLSARGRKHRLDFLVSGVCDMKTPFWKQVNKNGEVSYGI